jgi:hypothetical protein
MNLSSLVKYWIELAKTPDHVLLVEGDSGFVSAQSTADEVQDFKPSNKQLY